MNTLVGQRIEGSDSGEAREVAVGRPQFRDAMFETQSRDARIVHRTAASAALAKNIGENSPVSIRLLEEHEARSVEPDFYLFNRGFHRSRIPEQPRIGDNGEEFMEARPRDRPHLTTRREDLEYAKRGVVVRRIATVRVHQQVCVHGDHGALFRLLSRFDLGASSKKPG